MTRKAVAADRYCSRLRRWYWSCPRLYARRWRDRLQPSCTWRLRYTIITPSIVAVASRGLYWNRACVWRIGPLRRGGKAQSDGIAPLPREILQQLNSGSWHAWMVCYPKWMPVLLHMRLAKSSIPGALADTARQWYEAVSHSQEKHLVRSGGFDYSRRRKLPTQVMGLTRMPMLLISRAQPENIIPEEQVTIKVPAVIVRGERLS